MSKRPPEMTWQDKAILITIPLVVFTIFIVANQVSKDLTVSEAFQQKLAKVIVRDGGDITQLVPTTASNSLLCRIRSRDGQVEYTLDYCDLATDTPKFEVGHRIQFSAEYSHDPQGGVVHAPYKGKSGRWSGWVVYQSKRFSAPDRAGGL